MSERERLPEVGTVGALRAEIPDEWDFDVCAECGEPYTPSMETCAVCGEDRIEPVSMFLAKIYPRLLLAQKREPDAWIHPGQVERLHRRKQGSFWLNADVEPDPDDIPVYFGTPPTEEPCGS